MCILFSLIQNIFFFYFLNKIGFCNWFFFCTLKSECVKVGNSEILLKVGSLRNICSSLEETEMTPLGLRRVARTERHVCIFVWFFNGSSVHGRVSGTSARKLAGPRRPVAYTVHTQRGCKWRRPRERFEGRGKKPTHRAPAAAEIAGRNGSAAAAARDVNPRAAVPAIHRGRVYGVLSSAEQPLKRRRRQRRRP